MSLQSPINSPMSIAAPNIVGAKISDWSRYTTPKFDVADLAAGKILPAPWEPILINGKAAFTPGWTEGEMTPSRLADEMKRYPGKATGIGLRTGKLVGVDVDCTDDKRSEYINSLMTWTLGKDALYRHGSKGFMALYQIETPIEKLVLTFSKDSEEHKIEILGDGQQLAAFGHVPADAKKKTASFDYKWLDGRSPIDDDFFTLPLVAADMLHKFLTLVSDRLRDDGFTVSEIGKVSTATGRTKESWTPNPRTDSDPNVEKYTDYLMRRSGAIQGQEGDKHTFITIRNGSEMGCSPEKTYEVILEHWNEKCLPPWRADDLWYKIKAAYRNGNKKQDSKAPLLERLDDQDTVLSKAKEPAEAALDDMIEAMFEHARNHDKLASTIGARRLTTNDGNAENHEGMEYIFGKTYSRGLVAFTAAPGGSGKSSHLLLRAVFAAVGRKLFQKVIEGGGDCADRVKAMFHAGEIPEDEPVKTWYWNLEDSSPNTKLRVIGICALYGISFEKVIENLYLNGSEDQMTVAHPGDKGMTKIFVPVLKSMAREVITKGIQLLFVDPFIKTVEVSSENDNATMKVAIGAWTLLAAKLNIAIGLAHHAAKWNGKDIEMYKAAALRGAGTLHDSVRLVEVFVPMNEDEKSVSVPVPEYHRYYYVFSKKENFGFNWRERTWFTFIGHEVAAFKGSSKPDQKRSVGVVIVARINTHLTGFSGAQVAAMLSIIQDMTPPIDPVDPRYADFWDDVKQGPATLTANARGNVTWKFAEVLGLTGDLNDIGDRKPAAARQRISKAMGGLVDEKLVVQGEVFSPWRKKKGQGPMKDAFTLTPAGHLFIENHRRQELKAGALDEGEGDNF